MPNSVSKLYSIFNIIVTYYYHQTIKLFISFFSFLYCTNRKILITLWSATGGNGWVMLIIFILSPRENFFAKTNENKREIKRRDKRSWITLFSVPLWLFSRCCENGRVNQNETKNDDEPKRNDRKEKTLEIFNLCVCYVQHFNWHFTLDLVG